MAKNKYPRFFLGNEATLAPKNRGPSANAWQNVKRPITTHKQWKPHTPRRECHVFGV